MSRLLPEPWVTRFLAARGYCHTPDLGYCCGPSTWCCKRAGEHHHDETWPGLEAEQQQEVPC